MNRIVVIGNGFDKAHGLATGYKDFIDDYWNKFSAAIYGGYDRWQTKTYGGSIRLNYYKDEFVEFRVAYKHLNEVRLNRDEVSLDDMLWNYNDVQEFIRLLNSKNDVCQIAKLTFKNKFFGHISGRCSLTNWLDIENEYYEKLKELLDEKDRDERNQGVKRLNQDFEAVKKLLEKYLSKIVEETDFGIISSVKDALGKLIDPEEIAHGKRGAFFKSIMDIMGMTGDDIDMQQTIENDYMLLSKEESVRLYIQNKLKTDRFKEEYCRPVETLLLNFNYTDIAEIGRAHV